MIGRVCVILAGTGLLSACTSFSGVPEPVISVQQARQMVANNLPDQVIQDMDGKSPEYRKVKRNRVVATYLMAADAKYDQFRGDLSRNVKGGNVAFDILTLGLTGIASRAKSAADDLAAAATVAGGVRGSLNHELYFEKTLPTLLSLMDSRRLEVRTDIINGLAKSETDYTIEEAFGDIWRYQAAASIDGAIQQAAAGAADQAQQAEYDYSKAVKLCRASSEVGATRRTLMLKLESMRNKAKSTQDPQEAVALRTAIQKAADAAGIADAKVTTTPEETAAQVKAISGFLLKVCSADDLAAFTAQAGV